jgi:hypothetical protein
VELFPGVNDALEVSHFERCATDEATVNVWLCEELRCIRSLARTAVED